MTKRTIRIENREVEIDDLTRGIKHSIDYFDCISQVCKTADIAKKFPSLNIILDSEHDNRAFNANGVQSAAFVDPREKNTIHIQIESIETLPPSAIKIQIAHTLTHELTHLWHEQISEYSKGMRVMNKLIELKNTWQRESGDIKGFIYNDEYFLRCVLTSFFTKLIIEGAADYTSYCQTGKISFDALNARVLHFAARQQAQEVLASLDAMLLSPNIDAKVVKERLHEFMTQTLTGQGIIGEHMIHTVLYMDKTLDFDAVLRMNYISFIKKYEECSRAAGWKPIVSVTSGLGMIDYAASIRRWLDYIGKLA